MRSPLSTNYLMPSHEICNHRITRRTYVNALQLAVAANCLTSVRLLLHNARVDLEASGRLGTALEVSCGRPDIMEELLKRRERGMTAEVLRELCFERGWKDIIPVVMSAGKIKDPATWRCKESGRSLLHVAAEVEHRRDNKGFASFALQAGVDLNSRDCNALAASKCGR